MTDRADEIAAEMIKRDWRPFDREEFAAALRSYGVECRNVGLAEAGALLRSRGWTALDITASLEELKS